MKYSQITPFYVVSRSPSVRRVLVEIEKVFKLVTKYDVTLREEGVG